jgi:hypothetical protein
MLLINVKQKCLKAFINKGFGGFNSLKLWALKSALISINYNKDNHIFYPNMIYFFHKMDSMKIKQVNIILTILIY